ncbi:MAG: hypothetical protein KDB21_15510 [Acidimicrobiales bacterium]|nr:hypothetical protein [Acidimicrobiales bacterium]
MYPLLIFAVCGAIMAVVVWRSRPEPGPWDISPAPDTDIDTSVRAAEVDRSELDRWHRDHEGTIAEWIERHEAAVSRLRELDAPTEVDVSHLTDLEGPMREAVASHPAPVMRAELSAMQAAANASIHAFRRQDHASARRQHITYLSYRNRWIDRLWQFPVDAPRIRRLRRHLPPSADDFAVGDTAPELTADSDQAVSDS